MRRTGAVRAGKEFYQPGRRAARGGGVLVVRDVDDPVAVADRNAGERRDIFSLEPALRRCRMKPVNRQHKKRRGERGGVFAAYPKR